MAGSSHRIRTMRWEVATGPAGDPFALRKRLQDRWQEVLPAFEALFDAVGAGDEVIRVSRLEVRVRAGSEETILQAISEAIPLQIREQLRAASEPPVNGRKEGAVRRVPAGEDRIGQLRHYLLTGALSWDAATLPPAEAAAAFVAVRREEWPTILEEVVSWNRAEVYFRLFQIVSQKEEGFLIDFVSGDLSGAWRPLAEVCRALLRAEPALLTRYTRLRLLAVFLVEGMKGNGRDRKPDLSSLADRLIPFEEKGLFPLWVARLSPAAAALFRRGPEEPNGSAEVPRGKQAERRRRSDERGPRIARSPRKGPENEREGRLPSGLSREPKESDEDFIPTPVSPRGAGEQPAALQEGAERRLRREESPLSFPIEENTEAVWRLHHAGLVLIHPYVARFFENTGMTGADRAVIPADRLPRAACLLHLLATGREAVYEFELGFIKLLLGLHPQAPLPVSEGLIRESDRTEAEAMLDSVIGYWKVLKSTSVDGLRSSFLQRPGLLREEEGGWRLQMEKMPFDLLIERLPWGIGIVRLPWMKKPLYTEW